METGAMAAREQLAAERIGAAAVALGERFGLVQEAEALVQAGHKDKQVSALFRSEAVAALLEALAVVTAEPAKPAAKPDSKK